MSEIAENASVTILVADFANVDAAGKINLLGAGVAMVGFDPMQGLTSRFSIGVVIHVPTKFLPADFSFEISLVSQGGELVMLPGPAEAQPLRVAQPVSMDRPNVSSSPAIRGHIGSNHQAVLDFSNGLPLAVGGLYEWHVRIDGDVDRVWTYPFAVAGPQGPVFG